MPTSNIAQAAFPNAHTPAPQATVGASNLISNNTSSNNVSFVDSMPKVDEEEDGYGSDEHPSHYPRPGHGLMRTLPPEQEDLQWLVDDESSFGVFSHMYQVDPQSQQAGGGGGGGGGMSMGGQAR